MTKHTTTIPALPDPKSPFARWIGATCVALWAVGVQAFRPPWMQVLAFFSPGFGYVAGHGAELIIAKYIQQPQLKKSEQIRSEQLQKYAESLDLIESKIEALKASGASKATLDQYEKLLSDAHKKIVDTIRSSFTELR